MAVLICTFDLCKSITLEKYSKWEIKFILGELKECLFKFLKRFYNVKWLQKTHRHTPCTLKNFIKHEKQIVKRGLTVC